MACSCPQPVLAATLLQITLALGLLLLLQQQLVHGDSRNITAPILGASFTPPDNTFWVSPKHTFALGFLQLPTPDGFPQSFALSIFYFQLPQPNKTVVWRANQGYLLSRNSSLLLTEEGDLVLTDGGTRVWNTNTSGPGVTSASLTDGGNLILLNRTSSKVWESWGFPTDTLLPGQSLDAASNGVGMRLTPSRGRYFLAFKADGVLSLYFIGAADAKWFAYYSTDTSPQTYTRLYFDPSGRLVLLDDSTSGPDKVLLVSSTNQSSLERIVMGNEGILTLFALSADGKSWSAAGRFPLAVDPCSIMGVCGQYGICSSNDNCRCPPGFEVVNVADWAHEGCHPTHPMDCDLGTKMMKLPGVQYQYIQDHDTIYQVSALTEEECSQSCNSECLCAVAAYDGLTCRLGLLGQLLGGNNLTPSVVTYLKISAYANATIDPPPPPPSSSGERRIISDRAAIAIGIPFVLVTTLGLLSLAGWCYKRRKEARNEDIDDVDGEGDEPDGRPLLDGPVHYSYKELRAATNGFKEVLGRGGFGPVFKGVLAGGIPVAVKKLEARNFGQKQFKAEVRTIGNLHHVNLVRLRGYCVRGGDRLLVYDFMERGSLDKYLFAREVVEGDDGGNNVKEGSRKRLTSKPPLLDWERRFEIALETARAIKYLHEECEPVIVHCDIKPENILLDDEFCAKVSDFGMAQLVGGEFTGSITTVRGTAGYMAPEWVTSTRISSKADVYSFGMVLLELMSGRKVIDVSFEDSSRVELASWAYAQLLENHNSVVLVDPRLVSARASAIADLLPLHDNPEFLRTAYVSFWCIQRDPSLRPSMGNALQMLEGLLPILPPPYPF